MPVDVEEIADAPIFVLTFRDPLAMDDLERVFAAIAQLADQGQRVFVVSDLAEFSVTYSAIMLGLRLAVRRIPGGPGDRRITHIVTGNDGMLRQAVQYVQHGQYGRFDVRYCATVDEGLATARSELS